jgi:hypothetical protein
MSILAVVHVAVESHPVRPVTPADLTDAVRKNAIPTYYLLIFVPVSFPVLVIFMSEFNVTVLR